MASKKAAKVASAIDNTAALQPDEGVTIPRISLKEQGFAALKTRNGKMYEADNVAFRYPQMLKVVGEMKVSPAVAIGLQALNTLMCRAEVKVKPVTGETETDKARRDFLLSVLHDMDTSFQSTMQSISSFKEYGHQVSEVVFRRRLKRNGSAYDDGLVGLQALRNRPQNSISKWNFSEDGRELVSISQSIANVENSYRFQSLTDENGLIVIPRDKFLLFRCGGGDNPEGSSCLAPAYLAFKQLSLITDHLLTGISKDIAGVPFARLPPRYMDPLAAPADAAVYTATKQIVDNISAGTQAGIIFPSQVDPESKTEMFSFSLLENKSGKAYDIPAIIKMLQQNILAVLGCESLALGADKGGSLSLQDSQTNMLSLTVAYRLSEIANTFNKELVPMLWKMNSWDTSRMPTIEFSDVSSVSLEEFSKYIQRVMSVGGLEMDRGVMNKIREVGGFEPKPESEPIDEDNLSTALAGKSSSAGEGMAVGVTGDGTSKKPSGKDSSAQNADNSA